MTHLVLAIRDANNNRTLVIDRPSCNDRRSYALDGITFLSHPCPDKAELGTAIIMAKGGHQG